MRWRRLFQGIAVAAVAMLFASACLSESGGGGGDTGGQSGGGDKQIEIMYGFGGDQSKGFEGAMADFEKSSGITIKFTDASQSFDTLIRPRVQGNNLPDIALFPQPGLMLDFAKQGKLQDLSTMLNIDQLKGALVPGVLDASTLDGKTYGVPANFNVKSLVYYPKKAFEAKGYKIPTTIAELEALTNQIKSDGTTPWCVGIESGRRHRLGGHRLDRGLRAAVRRHREVRPVGQARDPVQRPAWSSRPRHEFEKLALADGNVFGGRKASSARNFGAAMNPMFDRTRRSASCTGRATSSLQKGFFPEKCGRTWTPRSASSSCRAWTPSTKPVLGGGDLAGAFSKDDDTKKVMEFLTSPEFKSEHRHGDLALAVQGLRPEELPERDDQQSPSWPTHRPCSGSTAPTRCRAPSAPAASGRAWSPGSAARRTSTTP